MIYPEKLFITGTDTAVGKTVVSSILVSGLKASYWKPVQAGHEQITDTEFVKKSTGLPDSHFYDELYNLKSSKSPHVAADNEGIVIEMSRFKLPKYFKGHLIVEGTGGLIVPLNDKFSIIDLIQQLHIPVLLVGKSDHGTINHTLLSVEALRARHIQVWGVVLIGKKQRSNERLILKYGNVQRLFHLEKLDNFEPDTIYRAFQEYLTTPVNE